MNKYHPSRDFWFKYFNLEWSWGGCFIISYLFSPFTYKTILYVRVIIIFVHIDYVRSKYIDQYSGIDYKKLKKKVVDEGQENVSPRGIDPRENHRSRFRKKDFVNQKSPGRN